MEIKKLISFDNIKKVTRAVVNYTDKVLTNLNTHINNKNNPHKVTKAQIGLANVDNTSDVNKVVYSKNMRWGGGSYTAFTPIDGGLARDFGANKFAFLKPEGITIEYSRDGGESWLDYGATAEQKVGLVSGIEQKFYIGKADANNRAQSNWKLRVTIDRGLGVVSTEVLKTIFSISTNGSIGCTCTITGVHVDGTEDVIAPKFGISGYPGYGVANEKYVLHNTSASYYKKVTYLFEHSYLVESSSVIGFVLNNIEAVGMGYTLKSEMARTGHLYKYDALQNAVFPNGVTADGVVCNGRIEGGSIVLGKRSAMNVLAGVAPSNTRQIVIRTAIPYKSGDSQARINVRCFNYYMAFDFSLCFYVYKDTLYKGLRFLSKDSTSVYLSTYVGEDGVSYWAVSLYRNDSTMGALAVEVDYASYWNNDTGVRLYKDGWSMVTSAENRGAVDIIPADNLVLVEPDVLRLSISGNAKCDGNGRDIVGTYATKVENTEVRQNLVDAIAQMAIMKNEIKALQEIISTTTPSPEPIPTNEP